MPNMEDREKKISVIIPIYNGEKYMLETMNSVIHQTYPNLEVLCIIDGTKDGSKDIIMGLGDSRITLIEQDNHGAAWTRNYGLSIATGQYVLFLDQDDVLHLNCLELAIREIERLDCAGIAVNGHLIDSNSQIIRRLYRFNKPNLNLRLLQKGNQLFTPSQVLLDRKMLMVTGGFDEASGLADDWDLWMRIIREGGQINFLDHYLFQYRIHESNQSRNLEKMVQSELHVINQKFESTNNQRKFMSYTFMRYASRAANWRALLTALYHNVSLLFNYRFYWTAAQILVSQLK